MTDFSFDYDVEDGWIIVDSEPFDEAAEVNKATVFALANGYMGTRGAPESVSPHLPGLVGCAVNGLYDSPTGGILDREMVNLPDWRSLCLKVDGEALPVEGAQAFTRRLNMRRGLLAQEVTWRTRQGKQITLSSERFISLHRPHLAAIRWQIQTDAGCSVVMRSRIDTNVNNRFASAHFADVQAAPEPRGGTVTITTIQQGYRVTVAADHDGPDAAEWSAELKPGAVENLCRFDLPSGGQADLVKWAAVYDSRFSEGDTAALCRWELAAARLHGYEAAREAHVSHWEERWTASDVVIEGDAEAQAALRFCLFHLLANAPHSERVSISARGLQGQDYWGSVFWDCEIYVLPFLIYTQPEFARRCLMYRFHTLDGARRKAASLGYVGAYYAWQSQETGDETCALYVFDDPLTGEKIRSYFADEQIHISADVVYALWQYAWATGDTAFLYPYGLEIAVEVARFFASRVTYREDRGCYELRVVLGPDEYHERVDNNAYTNVMARHALRAALALADSAPPDTPTPDASELERWRDIAERLVVPQPDSQTALIEQFDGYFDLEDVPPDVARSRLKHPDQHPGGLTGPFQSTQAIKQADVALLLYLFRSGYDDAVKRANWRYYEPRTAHDSSLSPMAYALVAADIGLTDWAYRYFRQTATMDLLGSGPHWNLGVHTAAMGGAWSVVTHGFCRLHLHEMGVVLRDWPLLPEGWRRVSFRFCWQGQPVQFSTDGEYTTLSVDAGSVPVMVPGGQATLVAGSPLTFRRPQGHSHQPIVTSYG